MAWISAAGVYTMAPWAVMFIMMNVAGWIADSLIARNWDITTVRKLMQSIGLLGSAFFLFVTRTVTTPDMALLSLSGALGYWHLPTPVPPPTYWISRRALAVCCSVS